MRCEAVDVSKGRALSRELACQSCGCTENQACEGGCYWVSFDPPICSACVETAQDLDGIADQGFFSQQRCPASPAPALHAPIWIDSTSGYCARCYEGFIA